MNAKSLTELVEWGTSLERGTDRNISVLGTRMMDSPVGLGLFFSVYLPSRSHIFLARLYVVIDIRTILC